MLPTQTWKTGNRKSPSCTLVVPRTYLEKYNYKIGDELHIDWDIVLAISKAHEKDKEEKR